MSMIRLRAGVASLGLSLVVAACSPAASPSPSASSAESSAPAASAELGEGVSFELDYGVLAGLTGDLAVSGQPWRAAAELAVNDIQKTLDEMGLGGRIKVKLAGAEDSQGNATGGIEAATKLVDVDKSNIVIGDFFSSVTIAAAESVMIPKNVLVFTGGTNPAISDLADNGMVWRPVSSDALQGKVVASILAKRFGAGATINVGYRNDAYGTGLSEVFKQAWTAGGGKIGEEVAFNEGAATLDTEAQQLASGNPDGWFVVAFCGDWGKLRGPLSRAAGFDGTKTFSSDSLRECVDPDTLIPGMQGTSGSSTGGTSWPAYKELFEKTYTDVAFQAFTSQAFDAVYTSFLAALAAKSSDTNKIKEQLVAVSGPGGTTYNFTQLKDAITAVLNGEDIDFEGATGPINFDEKGDISVNLFEVWEIGADNKPTVKEVVPYTP